MPVLTGLDRVVLEQLIKEENIGLVVNQTSVNRSLVHIITLMKKLGKKIKVFALEHGLYGAEPPGKHVKSYVDEYYGVQVISLYGEKKEPSKEDLEDLEAVVFDVQDVGSRWYTYISSLYYVIKASGRVGVKVYVLDRPNPITGRVVEGSVLKSEFKSFIGVAEIPARHGMTIGELSFFFNNYYSLGAEVEVIEMTGWERWMWFDDTSLPWIPPSPNIPTPHTALLYAGACLFEGTNISEGRGTCKPFEYFGSPWLKWKQVYKELCRKTPGVVLRPTLFRPVAYKYSGETCKGFQVHVINRNVFRPFKVFLKIIEVVYRLHSNEFEWVKSKDHYVFDLLAGTDHIRKRIEQGECVEDFYHEVEYESFKFKKSIFEKYIIY